MPVTTVYSSSDDGIVTGQDATYATARTTASSVASTATSNRVGQQFGVTAGQYDCIEMFMDFDVSGVPNVANASAVSFSLYTISDFSVQDFTLTAANIADYGTLATGDWVSGASLSGLTTAATISTVGIATSTYNALTNSGTVLLDDVKAGGNTSLLLYSSEQSANNPPASGGTLNIRMSENTGTSEDPKLDITTPAVGGTFPSNTFTHLLVR